MSKIARALRSLENRSLAIIHTSRPFCPGTSAWREVLQLQTLWRYLSNIED